MLGRTRPGRVVAEQAEAQYRAMPIAKQCVAISDGEDQLALPCYASHSLEGTLPKRINRLLVVVHGALRDADNYLAHATAADRKSTRLNSSHVEISYAVFCLKKKIKATAGSASKSRF